MKKAKSSSNANIFKTLSRFKFWGTGLLIVIAVVCVYFLFKGIDQSHLNLGSDHNIDITPEKVVEIKNIGQWEFLSVVDEEVIDTIRHNRVFADDRLSCIYYGNPRIGIDLTYAPDDWVVCHGDTVFVNLPKPSLLDNNFIDEARTRVFYEKGRWSAPAKDQMYRRAARNMRARALTPENINIVKQRASQRFRDLFLSLGAGSVVITYDEDSASDSFIK